MKRALTLVLVVASVAAIAVTAGGATAASAKKQDTNLSGAGSSFVFPLVSKWIPALGTAYGYSVSYSPIGSGGGIAADHGAHRRLRRHRRPALGRSADGVQGLRPDPVGALGHVGDVQPARASTASCG